MQIAGQIVGQTNAKTDLALANQELLIDLVTALASTFSKEVDEPLLLGYSMALEDLSVDQIRLAFKRAIRECQFMPSGAELRRLGGVPKPENRAVLAWSAVKRAIRDYDYTKSITFDDPCVNATVRLLGGWESICDTEIGEKFDTWTRKQFEQTYMSLYETGFSEDQARPLIGFHDRVNASGGHKESVKQPIMITTGLPVSERHRLLASSGRQSERLALTHEITAGVGDMPRR